MVESVTSTLFYGIFVEELQLAIATKVYYDLINVYDPLILELSSQRSSHNLPNVPNEIWEQIKDELRKALLIRLKVDYLTFLKCVCCKAGGCSNVEEHSFYSSHDHASPSSYHAQWLEVYNRQCCIESIESCHGGELGAINEWIDKLGITTVTIQRFLKLFDLQLITPAQHFANLDYDSTWIHPIGPSEVLERKTATHDASGAGVEEELTTLSTLTLRNFDYDSVNLNFERLQEEYGIIGVKFNKSKAVIKSSLISSDEDSVPAWRLWCRL